MMSAGAETVKQRCAAMTRAGAPCRGWALPERDYCVFHSAEAVEGRRSGGAASSNVQRGLKRLPPNLREVMDHVALGVEQVHEGALKPAQLSAMAAGAMALIKLVEAAVLAPEVEALRVQVRELLALSEREEESVVEP